MRSGRAVVRVGRWWFIPAGLVLLIIANYFFHRQKLPVYAVAALVAGILLVGADVYRSGWVKDRTPGIANALTAGPKVRWKFLVVAALAGVVAFLRAADNTFTTLGVIAWVVAVVAWFAAWWPAKKVLIREFSFSVPTAVSTRTVLTVIGVALAVAVGAIYRFYHIASTPLYPTSDHSEKLLDVTDVLNGIHPIFFERNTGREPFQFYFTAGLIRLFDLSVSFTTLKIGTAFVGTVAILFVYLLAAEYAGRVAGLAAAFLLAVSTWGTEISRAGLRFPYAMVASAAVLWVFVRWMRTKDRRDALICGLFIGMGLNGYSPFRVVVPAVCLGMVIAIVAAKDHSERLRLAADSLLIGATAAVFFIPLGRYALQKPDMFWFRSSSQLTGVEGSGSSIQAFFDNLPQFLTNNWHAAIGPFWRGDSTMVNSVSYAPMMDTVSGALLLAGLAAILMHIFVSRDPRSIFLVATIPILLTSSTLSLAFPWENPSVNRESPVIPVVYTIAALPIALLSIRLLNRFGRSAGTLLVVYASVALIAVGAVQNYRQYFHTFDRQTRDIVANTTEISAAIRGGRTVGVALEDTYVIDSPNWFDIRNVGFQLGNIDWAFTHNVVAEMPLPEQPAGRPMLLIINANDTARLEEIERKFPNSYVSTYPSDFPPKSFVTVFIPAE